MVQDILEQNVGGKSVLYKKWEVKRLSNGIRSNDN